MVYPVLEVSASSDLFKHWVTQKLRFLLARFEQFSEATALTDPDAMGAAYHLTCFPSDQHRPTMGV